jgi:hypothetical protein
VSTYSAHCTRAARTIASIGAAILVGPSRQCTLSSKGRDIICRKMPSSKFGRLARYTIAPRRGAFQSGEQLKIVAIESSSTVGLWVLRSATTHPEVMRRELSRLRSNAAIEVINNGRIGEVARSALVTWDCTTPPMVMIAFGERLLGPSQRARVERPSSGTRNLAPSQEFGPGRRAKRTDARESQENRFSSAITATARSQRLTGIRADDVRTCAHAPFCQPAN